MPYVEYIKVGSGESWPIRDAAARESISNIDDVIAELESTLTTLQGKVNTNTSSISTANTNISTTNTNLNALGTRVGALETNALTMIWPSTLKGPSFPANPTTGQIFLKKV